MPNLILQTDPTTKLNPYLIPLLQVGVLDVRRLWLGGPLINNRTANKKGRLGRTDRRQNADKTYKAMTEWFYFKAG